MKKLLVITAVILTMGCAQVSGPVGKAGDTVTDATAVAVDFANKVVSSGIFDNLKAAGKAVGDLIKAVGGLFEPADEAPSAPPVE